MPPKKSTTTGNANTSSSVKAKRSSAPATHASYKDMIKDAILNLKERNGSSRQAIKKYVLANNNINVTSTKAFDTNFNRTIKTGVDNGDFTQPKGPSGPVKLAKKEAKKEPKASSTKKPKEPKKETKKDVEPKEDEKKKEKKTTTKKSTTKAAEPMKVSTGGKALGTTKKTKAKTTTTTTAAPAEKKTILSKTKSGRVTKQTAPEPAKKATAKKATAKKPTPKKKADAEAAAAAEES